MLQLTGLDAAFLYMETPSTVGHVGSLAIFDAPTASGRLNMDDLAELVEARLHLVPPMRRRVIEVPLGIDHPYWVEDPDFDLDYHLRHIALPPPGNRQQLAEQVSRLAARPLDRTRPLWELYLIEGLEDGRVAQYTKIHHAAIDGVSGAEIMTVLLDVSPEPREVAPPKEAWKPEPVPSDMEVLMRTLFALPTHPLEALRFQARLLSTLGIRARARDVQRVALLPALANLGALAMPVLNDILERLAPERSQEGELLEKPPSKAPRLSFNTTITPHRRYAFGTLSLDDVKAIKNAAGTTVNDVVMALCSGALRRWLIEHNELPDDPLVAMIPVSVRTEEEKGKLGNRVSTMMAALPTNESDPRKALERVHASMKSAKAQHAAIPANLLADFAQFATPALAARAARAVARTGLVDRIDPICNVVISNVPGPNFPLYSAGARVVGSYPVSTIGDGMGLNITVQSYMNNLDFGLISCRELVPDVWRLMDHLGEALEELKQAVGI